MKYNLVVFCSFLMICACSGRSINEIGDVSGIPDTDLPDIVSDTDK